MTVQQRNARRAKGTYECEIVEGQGKPECDLTDLTPLATGGSADVLNLLAGVSEDGSSVYFVANGVLAVGASQGDCVHQSQETVPAGASCNLYEWHEGVITFIASLSNEDSGDWGSLQGSGRVSGYVVNRPDLADLTAAVSQNGRYLAFMSQRPLVGYETLDAVHGGEGVRDEEVYLFDSASGLLTCVSCDPNGPPVGVHDIEHSGEGVGLIVDRRGDWSGAYLAGSIPGWTPLGVDDAVRQPRYLSNEGRLFFDSPDRLVAQAANGREDVFEYEPAGVGSCGKQAGCVALVSSPSAAQESALVEASDSGEDAFFVTAQPLVAADHDSNYDLYDARVCAAASPCLTSQSSSASSCEATASCRPGSAVPLALGTPASASIITASQQALASSDTQAHTAAKRKPLTRTQLLAKALAACRKIKDKHQRVGCERQARKRYGPKPKSKEKADKQTRTARGGRR